MKRFTPQQLANTPAGRNGLNNHLKEQLAGKVLPEPRKSQPQAGIAANMQALGRMKQGEMNKTERRYFDKLTLQQQAGEILWFAFEPLNLRLADKCFYKVDFMVLTAERELEVHEVKGFWTDDARVKIKVAAAKFPFRFKAVQFINNEWKTEEL